MKKMVKTLSILLSLVLVFQFAPISTRANAAGTLSEAKEGVMQVLTMCYENGEFYGYRNGAGIAIGEPGQPVKYILTNYYVYDRSAWPSGSDVDTYVGVDDELLDVKAAYINSERQAADLVLLELAEPITSRTNLQFYPSTYLHLDQSLCSLGFSDLLDDDDEWLFDIRDVEIQKGKLMDLSKNIDGEIFLMASNDPLYDGFFGGPLVTGEGYVVGLNTFFEEDSTGKHVTSYPSTFVLEYLMEMGIVEPSVYDPQGSWKPNLSNSAKAIKLDGGTGSTPSTPAPTPTPTPTPQTLAGGYLSGEWGSGSVSTRTTANSTQSYFELDTPVYNCTELTVQLEIVEYTGYPFDWWYLDGRDLHGNWTHIGSFKLGKEAIGNAVDYVVKLKNPSSFDALTVVSSSNYNSYSLTYDLYFKDAVTK